MFDCLINSIFGIILKKHCLVENFKLGYETPRTGTVTLRSEGLICSSDPVFRGFEKEKEW